MKGGLSNPLMNFDADNVNEQQVTVKTPESLKRACEYCGFNKIESLIRCDDCMKCFCNGPGETYSTHAIDHLSRSGHKKVSLFGSGIFDNEALECHNCGCQNIFSLGFITSTLGDLVFLCRQPCDSQELLEPLKLSVEAWLPLICERQIVTWLVCGLSKYERSKCLKVSSQKTMELEERWKLDPSVTMFDILKEPIVQQDMWKTPKSFENVDEHFDFFGKLVQLEMEHQKELSQKVISKNVAVEWKIDSKQSAMATFVLKSMELEVDLRPADIVRLRHSDVDWYCEGTILKIPDAVNEKFIMKMSRKFVETDKIKDFVLERVWNPVTFLRMNAALKKMKTSQTKKLPVEKNIFDLIIGKRDNLKNGHVLMESTSSTFVESDLSVYLPNFGDLPNLNPSQASAVKHALERSLSLIQGPPGTGKTVTAASIIYQMVRSNPSRERKQVLVCASSNVAVDHLAEKIHQTGLNVVRVYAVRQESFESSVSFLGLHNQIKTLPDYKEFEANAKENRRKGFWRMKKKCEKTVLTNAEVVCCTCIAAADRRLAKFNFEYLLIDECVQASEPESLVPIVKGVKHLVLVGDQQQLGPTVMNDQASREGLSISLFERLLEQGILPHCLQIQYRMHPVIAEFPSAQFYQNFLLNGVNASDHTLKELDQFWPMTEKPMLFFPSHIKDEIASSGTSYLNRGEARIVVQMVLKLIQCGLNGDQIGIITPYLGQRRYLKQYIKSSGLFAKETYGSIEVFSVDSFQGREKAFIIISAVRSNQWQGVGFLRDYRRLNVALTRAKYGIVVIGNPVSLNRDPNWRHLIRFYKEKNCLIEGNLGFISLANQINKIDLNS